MPRSVIDIPRARPATETGTPNPVTKAVADVVNDMHGVAVIRELKRAMVDPPTPVANPMQEHLGQAAQAMGTLTNSVVTASTGLAESYQRQSANSLEQAKFEAERRREAEEQARYEREQTDERVGQAVAATKQEDNQTLAIVTEANKSTQQLIMQMMESRITATSAEFKGQLTRLEERSDFKETLHRMELAAIQQKLDEAEYAAQHRPPSFEEQLFRAVVQRYGDGDLAKALPALLGGGGHMTSAERLENAKAGWYERMLESDVKRRELEAEGAKAMKEGVGEGVKTFATIAAEALSGLTGIPLPGRSEKAPALLPDTPPAPGTASLDDLAHLMASETSEMGAVANG